MKGSRAKYTTATAKVEYDVGPGSIVANSSFAKYDVDTFIDFTNAYGYILTLLAGVPAGTFTTPTRGNLAMKKYTEELRFVSKRLGPVEFLLGGYYTHERTGFFAETRINALPGLEPFPAPYTYLSNGLTSGTYREISGYGNLTFYVTDRFDITGGFRYSDNKQSYRQSTTQDAVIPGGQPITTARVGFGQNISCDGTLAAE
ncbi:hypothetical protein ACFSTD_23805 [Novosphingobium colocasiae]